LKLLILNQSSTEIADFSSDDEFSKEINCYLLFHVYYMRVAKLLLSIVKLQKSTQLESESLSCDIYEALNNVRIMFRASHRNTDKREFKAKERDLLRCEDYMYRRKRSAKLNKV